MDAAIITNSKLQADLNLQSTLIRTAVIISNNCWLSPSDIGLISHNDFFLSKFVGLKEKLYQLSIQAKRMDMSAYPDFVDAIDKLPAILKTLNSIKHPPPNIVKEKKKLEAWINSVYEDIVRQRSNVFSSSGLLQISEIIDKDYIYFLDKNDEGNYSNVDFVNHSVKDVMQLNFHETKGRPLIIFLRGEFGDVAPVFPHYYSSNDEEAKDKNNSWLDRIFDVTGFINLSHLSLIALRESVAEKRLAFNKAMDEWIYVTQNNSAEFDDLGYYKSKVEHLAKDLNQAISEHIILKPYQDTTNRYVMQLGALPVKEIWNYYFKINYFTQEEYDELMRDAGDPKYAGRWPVVSFGIYNAKLNKMNLPYENKETDTDINPIKRKVIDLS